MPIGVALVKLAQPLMPADDAQRLAVAQALACRFDGRARLVQRHRVEHLGCRVLDARKPCLLAHHVGIRLPVRRRRCVGHDLHQHLPICIAQAVQHRDHVDRLARGPLRADGIVHVPVLRRQKVIRRYAQHHVADDLRRDQHTADHGCLRIDQCLLYVHSGRPPPSAGCSAGACGSSSQRR